MMILHLVSTGQPRFQNRDCWSRATKSRARPLEVSIWDNRKSGQKNMADRPAGCCGRDPELPTDENREDFASGRAGDCDPSSSKDSRPHQPRTSTSLRGPRRDASAPRTRANRASPLRASTMTSMTVGNDSFPRFLVRLQARDGEAAREVFRRFTSQLIALARRRFSPRVPSQGRSRGRRPVGVQELLPPLRRGEAGGRQLERPVGPAHPDHAAEVCRAGRLSSCPMPRRRAGSFGARPGDEDGTRWLEVPGREPTPHEAAELSETVDRLLAELDEDERPVIELSLQGYTAREISQRLDRAERTVRRLRERVRSRLEREHSNGCRGSR